MTDERKQALATEFGLYWPSLRVGSTSISDIQFAVLDGISNLMFGQKLLADQLTEIKRQIDHVAEP